MTSPATPRLGGILSALVTPFRPDGAVNLDAIPALVELQLAQGVHGFYVGGSTGEAFLQTPQERIDVLREVARAARGRGRLIAHVGAIATQDSLRMGAAAAEAGYDAVSAIPPFYYDFSRDDLLAHYMRLVEEVSLPLIVYNFGGRVGRLTADDLLRLLDEPKVAGVKHTSQDLYLLERFKRHRPDAVIFNGYDEMCLAGLAMGADGAIGTTYNVMGDLFVALEAAFRVGDLPRARALQVRANTLIDVLIEVGVFPGTKALLKALGVDCGECRAPFRPLSPDQSQRLQAAFAAIRMTGAD
ncbi:N-acetylneuraminate lyase [Alsobacter sp. SYSU M60028]|uniref:N-acetylneuraminate lyase n=1 Tax=Alsobacter ponti TaxID=2962936 RepID=A0ABT1L8G0_9HYPH|nr:N-acetylneuraminate lyase [Alsobacter ponti]MCP8937769.1 N-acetylneuraminate lyase [Alsobacter ponti]